MRLRIISLCLLLVMILTSVAEVSAQNLVAKSGAAVTPEKVRDAIEKGIRFLRKNVQDPNKGAWQEYVGQPGGVTSLATLALLESGVPVDDALIQKSLIYLRGFSGTNQPKKTYAVALQTMVFCAAEPEKDMALIRSNAAYLESIQIRGGERSGMWSYGKLGEGGGGGDNSNTQFALLALDQAANIGVKINEQTWRLSYNYWKSTQNANGSWGYLPGSGGTGSMTCAGTTSMIITSRRLTQGDAQVINGSVNCCGQQLQEDSIERAFRWLSRAFTVRSNPTDGGGGGSHLLYYLYGVERVGRLSGRRFIGDHDWYREGAELLVKQQQNFTGEWIGKGAVEARSPVISTCLALLFLGKGRRPILMSKLKYGEGKDWNNHRNDVNNLTGFVESKWKQKMTWQVIDVAVAAPEDLLQSPVLWISGKKGFKLTPQQEDNLRLYIEQGGFIFAEACCGGKDFDRDFRALVGRIFPDAPLRLLPPDHPVWYAEQRVDPKYVRPLFGIDACCRTSIVYCPQDLSCYWELNRAVDQITEKPIRDEILACNLIGTNVLTYATGRQLKDKLEQIEIDVNEGVGDTQTRNTFYIAKLQHGGGADDAPAALSNMVKVAGSQLELRFDATRKLISLSSEKLHEYPILFMHGRRDFRFNAKQRKTLATFLNNGGFLFADAICASVPFQEAFRREIKAALPDAQWKRIPLDHPMFSDEYQGFDVTTVSINDPQAPGTGEGLKTRQRKIAPLLEGIWIDERLVIAFSPNDMSCAMESGNSLQCKGYTREDAARLATNIILFAMQQ